MTDTGRMTGKDYLVNEQYRDATNLQVRMQLHERFAKSGGLFTARN